MCSQTLINLCLDTIVSNFSKYNSLFTITKDDNIKRRFEFLQRKYSFDILSRLTAEEGLLEEQYVDLLINRYLKVLDTSWLENCSWEKVISKIAEIGSNVEKIMLHDGYFARGTFWQDACCFPNLKCLNIHESCRFLNTDSILKHVATFCHNIEEINLGYSVVSSESVKYFCKSECGEAPCTKLKKLNIEHTVIFDDHVKYLLQNLPSLEIVVYPKLPRVLYSLHKNDLSSLDNVKPYNITALDLNYCVGDPYSADIRQVCLSVCPHLKSLIIPLKNEEISFFPKLPDLEQLHIISKVSKPAHNIDKLLKGLYGELTSLSITGCTVSLPVLSESCPCIKELYLNMVEFLLDDDDSKPLFNSLTSLTFENCTVVKNTKAISLLLISSEKLESLTFKRCKLESSEIKAHILKCCELNPVNKATFECCGIDKGYIKDLLLNCHTLSYLNALGPFGDASELLEFAEVLPNKPKIDIKSMEYHDIDTVDLFADGYDDYYDNYDFEFPYQIHIDYPYNDDDQL